MNNIGQGTLLDRVRITREGADVERCHQLPHWLRYSVGHHTLNVVNLIVLSWKVAHNGELPRAELLVAAVYHDTPAERITGDISSPVKRLFAREALDDCEFTAQQRIGIADQLFVLTDEENDYLIGADRVELWIWAEEEAHQRGNTAAISFQETYDEIFEEQPPPWPLLDLVEAIRKDGFSRLPGNVLKEWGGVGEQS